GGPHQPALRGRRAGVGARRGRDPGQPDRPVRRGALVTQPAPDVQARVDALLRGQTDGLSPREAAYLLAVAANRAAGELHRLARRSRVTSFSSNATRFCESHAFTARQGAQRSWE